MTKRLALVLCACVIGAAFGFAAGQEDADAPKEISWQVWVTPNLSLEFWQEIADAFVAGTPDVTIELIEANAAVTPAADDFIKTRIAAGDVPDLMTNITINVFADAGILWPLPDDDPDLQRIRNVDTARYKGVLYGLPTAIQPQGLLYYNKSLWAQAGLGDTPRTWEEFADACATLRAAGITPIITGGEWVAGYAFSIFTSAEVFHHNPRWYADRWAGTVSFEEGFAEAAEYYKQLVDDGCFNKGALSVGYADLEQQFLAGKAAIYPMGSWFTAAEANADKDFEVGVFYAPSSDGVPHLLQSLSYGSGGIYNESEHPEVAFELLKFALMDDVYGTKLLQVDGLFSALDPPLTYPMSVLQQEMMDMLAEPPTTSGLYGLIVGEAPPGGINAVYDRVGQAFLAGTVSDVRQALREFDDFWDSATQ
ncbi:MAG: ABC transporter substrate-binding protein [Spirochaetaceae bacterium]|nr:ABC transporter substrate-binding protein [Spirochaetaceae bacterium]